MYFVVQANTKQFNPRKKISVGAGNPDISFIKFLLRI